MIRLHTGIVTKLVGAALRIAVLGPALIGLFTALEALHRPNSWFKPMSHFWYLPLLTGLFALLCIIPYPGVLFKRITKPLLLSIVLLVCAFKLRYEFLPFHYAAPELANYPAYVAEFEAAKREANGFGFSSEREEGGRMLWIVRKGHFTTENIITMGSFSLVPLFLFLLRSYEVRRGITWRNFMSPPVSSPSGHAATSSPTL